jgi:hypothetical protein
MIHGYPSTLKETFVQAAGSSSPAAYKIKLLTEG